MRMLKDKKGFTLIEVIVILAVIAILAAVLTPMIIGYITDAKMRRAEADVRTIGAAIQAFNKDLREWPIWASGTQTGRTDTQYDVLYSEAGDQITQVSTGTLTDWTTTDADTLDDQLVTNDPSYSTTGKRKWMGPYLENISEDPWGNKYYVTVEYLQPNYLSPGSQKAVFALSAGPDEEIDTDFEQAVTGFSVGGDDIAYRIK